MCQLRFEDSFQGQSALKGTVKTQLPWAKAVRDISVVAAAYTKQQWVSRGSPRRYCTNENAGLELLYH